jgi:membrane-bound lytic murein transglycosylase MltF
MTLASLLSGFNKISKTHYRGYENIFGKMHKAIKAQENVIRQQTDIINKLTQRNVRASADSADSAASAASADAECKPSAPAAGSA